MNNFQVTPKSRIPRWFLDITKDNQFQRLSFDVFKKYLGVMTTINMFNKNTRDILIQNYNNGGDPGTRNIEQVVNSHLGKLYDIFIAYDKDQSLLYLQPNQFVGVDKLKESVDRYTKYVLSKIEEQEKVNKEFSIKMEKKDLSFILNSLLADEISQWWTYWIMYQCSQGTSYHSMAEVFKDNAEDELNDHGVKLITWMQANDIDVLVQLPELLATAGCPVPKFECGIDTLFAISLNIASERNAIIKYRQRAKEVQDDYPDLAQLFMEISNDEQEHLNDNIDLGTQVGVPDSILSGTSLSGISTEKEVNFILNEISSVNSNFSESIKSLRNRIKSFSDKWSQDVDTKWEPRPGLFEDGTAEEIAQAEFEGHKDLKSAISSLNFYLNRGGDNIPEDRRKVIEEAKDLVRKKYEE